MFGSQMESECKEDAERSSSQLFSFGIDIIRSYLVKDFTTFTESTLPVLVGR